MSVFQEIYKSSANKVNIIQKADKTNITSYFCDVYENVLINSFKWKGINKFFVKNWLEMCLFDTSTIACFEEKGELLYYPAFPNGILLPNGLYDSYIIIPVFGAPYIRKLNEIELLFNCSTIQPSKTFVYPIIDKVVGSYSSIHNNILRAEVGGFVVAKDEEQVKCINDAILKTKIENGIVKVVLNENYAGDIQYVPIFDNTKSDIKTLWESFDKDIALIESNFGFLTTDIFKKERLTEAESMSGYDSIQYGLIDDMFERRKDFCERVNKHFNADLSVELNRSYRVNRPDNFTSDYNRNIYTTPTGGTPNE